jgi:hypothetical protein
VFVVEKCAEKFVSLDNLSILAEFVLCLPGSNASVERIFSLMNITGTMKRIGLHLV